MDKKREDNKPSRGYETFKEYLDIIGKLIPVVIFVSTLYGAWQLFSFARTYGIRFIDLVKSNVVITFGTLSFFLIIVMAMVVIAVMFVQHIEARFVVRNLIQKSKFPLIRRHRKIAILALSILMSLWGFIFLLPNGKAVSWVAAAAVILLFLYIFFGTYRRADNPQRWRHLFHSVYCLLTLIAPVFFFMLAMAILATLFEQKLHGVSVLTGVLCMVSGYFILTVLPLILSLKKPTHQGSLFLCGCFALCLFLLFTFPFSQVISGKIADIAGLGFKTQCYLKKDVLLSQVPARFIHSYHNDAVVRLNVIANLDDIYYLTTEMKEDAVAEFRFKSDQLKAIACSLENMAGVDER